MRCNTCNVEMVEGQVLVNILGNNQNNLDRGATVYPIGGAFTSCLKCPSCGRSITNEQPVGTTNGNIVRNFGS